MATRFIHFNYCCPLPCDWHCHRTCPRCGGKGYVPAYPVYPRIQPVIPKYIPIYVPVERPVPIQRIENRRWR